MDGSRFDDVARALAARLPRRPIAAFVVALFASARQTEEGEGAKQDRHRRKRSHERKKNEPAAGTGAEGKKKKKKKPAKCKPPTRKCGKRCVDVRTNAGHCGECNQSCGEGAGCIDGRCVAPLACPACGVCETCDLGPNGIACSDGCPEPCLAANLCASAARNAAYYKLADRLAELGYAPAGEPRASLLRETGTPPASVLMTSYGKPGGEIAELAFAASGSESSAYAVAASDVNDAVILYVGDDGEVAELLPFTEPNTGAGRNRAGSSVLCWEIPLGPTVCDAMCNIVVSSGCTWVSRIKLGAKCGRFGPIGAAGCVALNFAVCSAGVVSTDACAMVCDRLDCEKDTCEGVECGPGKRCREGRCECASECCDNDDCPRQRTCGRYGTCLCPAGSLYCDDGSCAEQCCSDNGCFASHRCGGDGRCHCRDQALFDCGDGQCRDLSADPDHCGACRQDGGDVCSASQTCVGGGCICRNGRTCGDACCQPCHECGDPETGECFYRCRDDQVCNEEANTCECPPGGDWAECDGLCRNNADDENYCGGCPSEESGELCGECEVCDGGACVPRAGGCGDGGTCCGGGCRPACAEGKTLDFETCQCKDSVCGPERRNRSGGACCVENDDCGDPCLECADNECQPVACGECQVCDGGACVPRPAEDGACSGSNGSCFTTPGRCGSTGACYCRQAASGSGKCGNVCAGYTYVCRRTCAECPGGFPNCIKLGCCKVNNEQWVGCASSCLVP